MKKTNLFNSSFLKKVYWFSKKFSFWELFRHPLRRLISPVVVKYKKKHFFYYEDKEYISFFHNYNITWANERTVEIPIVSHFIDKSKDGDLLEIGNVFSHYRTVNWNVIDKFEKNNNIINKDIIDFIPQQKYKNIISISTFEHIGFDDTEETSNSQEKIILALNHVKTNILIKGGNMLVTVPLGYNPSMDEIIFDNLFCFEKKCFLKKMSQNKWKQISIENARGERFNYPYPYGNSVAFLYL